MTAVLNMTYTYHSTTVTFRTLYARCIYRYQYSMSISILVRQSTKDGHSQTFGSICLYYGQNKVGVRRCVKGLTEIGGLRTAQNAEWHTSEWSVRAQPDSPPYIVTVWCNTSSTPLGGDSVKMGEGGVMV